MFGLARPVVRGFEPARRGLRPPERLRMSKTPNILLVTADHLRYDTLVKPWVRLRSGSWKDVIIEPH